MTCDSHDQLDNLHQSAGKTIGHSPTAKSIRPLSFQTTPSTPTHPDLTRSKDALIGPVRLRQVASPQQLPGVVPTCETGAVDDARTLPAVGVGGSREPAMSDGWDVQKFGFQRSETNWISG